MAACILSKDSRWERLIRSSTDRPPVLRFPESRRSISRSPSRSARGEIRLSRSSPRCLRSQGYPSNWSAWVISCSTIQSRSPSTGTPSLPAAETMFPSRKKTLPGSPARPGVSSGPVSYCPRTREERKPSRSPTWAVSVTPPTAQVRSPAPAAARCTTGSISLPKPSMLKSIHSALFAILSWRPPGGPCGSSMPVNLESGSMVVRTAPA